MKLPTSNLETFRKHLNNENRPYPIVEQDDQVSTISKVQKNIVLGYRADDTGCGHIRCIFPLTYLNSLFGKSGRFNMIISPVMIFQHDILMRTRSIFFQRTMSPNQIDMVRQYKSLQSKYGYRMIFDLDDFIWQGDKEGECIPDYNFGGASIKDDVRNASIEIMKMMDNVYVSTDFLGDYIKSKGVTVPIKTIPNTVSQHFWGNQRRKPITKKIIKPKVVWPASPTHFHNEKRLKGDMNNAWCDWVIKNVRENKIEYLQMGGLPYFFECIKDKIRIQGWVNSYMYHLPLKNFKSDFNIAPLVPNFFNYSKSNLKEIESAALGSIFMGTTFTNGYPSPYDDCFVKVPDNIDVKGIDEIFWPLTEPDNYNEILKKQYTRLYDEGWYLESDKAVNRYVEMLS